VSDLVPVTSAPSPLEWKAMTEMAEVIASSGMAPRSVDTPEKVLTISLKGRELRLPPMQALSHIHIVEGKPTLSAELMRALVQRDGHTIRVEEMTDTSVTVVGVRKDDPDNPLRRTWTIEQAQRAGVANKGPWKSYPGAMLLARATSELCRAMFADVLMGSSYTPEELGASVDEDGRVVEDGQVLGASVEEAYRDQEHTRLLNELEELISEADRLMVPGDYAATRQYAEQSTAYALRAIERVRERIAEAQDDSEGEARPSSPSESPTSPASPAEDDAPDEAQPPAEPVSPPAPAPEQDAQAGGIDSDADDGSPMGDNQRRAIFAALKEHGIEDDVRKAALFVVYGVDTMNDLTAAQASELLGKLSSVAGAHAFAMKGLREDPDPAPEPDDDVIEAEIVEEGNDSPPAPEPDGEAVPDAGGVNTDDWRALAGAAGVSAAEIIAELRKVWPKNDQARMPSRTSEIDKVWKDEACAEIVRTAIQSRAA